MADRTSQSIFEVLSNNANRHSLVSQNILEILANNAKRHSIVSQDIFEILVSAAEVAPPTPPVTARRFGPAIGSM